VQSRPDLLDQVWKFSDEIYATLETALQVYFVKQHGRGREESKGRGRGGGRGRCDGREAGRDGLSEGVCEGGRGKRQVRWERGWKGWIE
jgi:hypothetical protein